MSAIRLTTGLNLTRAAIAGATAYFFLNLLYSDI